MSHHYIQYTKAIVREIPDSFAAEAVRMSDIGCIDIKKARAEHSVYVEHLRRVLGKEHVFVLPANEAHPDSVFVEDPAVIIGNRALILNMGHASRRGEADDAYIGALKVFGQCEIGYLNDLSDKAFVDGGDVLFTGDHIFVGLSSRTNKKGAQMFAQFFDQGDILATITIDVLDGLHLKSVVTQMSGKILLVSDTECGRNAMKQIQKATNDAYKPVYVPDSAAANVVRVKNEVFVSSQFSNSIKIIKDAFDLSHTQNDGNEGKNEREIPNMTLLSTEEVHKADGALTCCSLLF